MLQRTGIVIAGCLGLAVLIVLGSWKGGLVRAVKKCPAWLRPLLAASFILLAWLGVAQAKEVAVQPPSQFEPIEAHSQAALAKTPEGRQIIRALKAVEPIPSNRSNAQLTKLQDDLNQASAQLAKLAAQKVIDPAQQALLAWRLAEDQNRLAQRLIVCYDQMYISPAQVSAQRLQDRLPFLTQIAAAKVLDPEALKQVLAQYDSDLATVARGSQEEGTQAPDQLSAEQRRQQAQDLQKVKDLVQGLNQRLSSK